MKCFLRRTVFGLAADDEMGDDALRGIPIGEYVSVDVRKERNAKHHRLYWVMVTKLARAVGLQPKVVSDTLKIRCGYYTLVETKDGRQFKIPASIAWGSMDQQKFSAFFDDVCREICAAWLPHMKPGRWRKDVLQMMGITWDEDDEAA